MSKLAEMVGAEDDDKSSPDMGDDGDDDGAEPKDPAHEMAETLIEAFKDGDAESLATTLKAFIAHCEMAPHMEASHTPPKLGALLGQE